MIVINNIYRLVLGDKASHWPEGWWHNIQTLWRQLSRHQVATTSGQSLPHHASRNLWRIDCITIQYEFNFLNMSRFEKTIFSYRPWKVILTCEILRDRWTWGKPVITNVWRYKINSTFHLKHQRDNLFYPHKINTYSLSFCLIYVTLLYSVILEVKSATNSLSPYIDD